MEREAIKPGSGRASARRGLICSVSFLFSIVGNESHSAANADDLIEEVLNIRSCHGTDMPTALGNVRSQGRSGKHLLALSFFGFDPEQTSSLIAV